MKKKWNLLRERANFYSQNGRRFAKACGIYLMLFFLGLSMPLAAQDRTVTLNVKNASLESVFLEFEKQTKYEFLFNSDLLASKGKVDVNAQNQPLREVLNAMLPSLGLRFSFEQNTIIISEVEKTSTTAGDGGVQSVYGSVTDEKKQPLPGVTILIEGTSVGTSTDNEGRFKLYLPSTITKGHLRFSFVGYKTQRRPYTAGDTLKVVLEEDSQEIDDVVVTGYQTLSRRDMVGSYNVVKMEDIIVPGYTSVQQMLQGRVPGLLVMNTSSRIGTTPKIRIRGTSTFIGNQDPLFVVDGIIQPDPIALNINEALTDDLANIIGNQISWLNPQDIETITVLKDASATAIYGSKAANGVIVITTKKTRTGETNVSYSTSLTFRRRPYYKDFNLMNSQERVQLSREAFEAGTRYHTDPYEDPNVFDGLQMMFINRKISESEFLEKTSDLETVNTNWFDLLTQTSFSHNHNLSISGNGNRVRYAVSLGYSKNKGIEIGNEGTNLSAHASLNAELWKNVNLNFSFSYSNNETYSFAIGVNPLEYATKTSRAIRAYDEEGNLSYYLKRNGYPENDPDVKIQYLSYNILNERDNSYSKNQTGSTNMNVNLSWDILPSLRYEFVGGYSTSVQHGETYAGEKTYYVASNYRGYDYNSVSPDSDAYKHAQLKFGGEFFHSDNISTNYNIQNKLLWSKTFNDEHRLNAMVALEIASNKTNRVANTAYGYTPDRGDGIVMPTSPSQLQTDGYLLQNQWGVYQGLSNGDWQKRKDTQNTVSYMATLAYSLKNRYVFNANVRSDASNRFGEYSKNRFNPTYSFGFSWQIAQEPFFQYLGDWLETASFRATYGIQGNVVSSVSPEMIVRKGDVQPVYEQYFSNILKLPNDNLDWESTKSWNLGFDFSMFRGIAFSIDYYWKKTTAMISQRLSSEYGMENMEDMGGKLSNSGLEFSFNVTPFRGENFAWTVGLNFAKNWNEGENAEINIPTIDDYLTGVSDAVLANGKDISSFWSFSFKGLNPENGYPEFNLMDIELENPDDPTPFLVYSGKSVPDFSGGLSTNLRYKRLSVGASFTVQLGNHKRLPSPFDSGYSLPSGEFNASRDLLRRWKQSGDEKTTDIPAFLNTEGFQYQIFPGATTGSQGWGSMSVHEMWDNSDVRVVDASFFRCNNLSISWSAEQKLLSKLHLKNLSLSLSVANLFVIASDKFQGFDPELGDSVNPKTYSFGINVGF